MTQAKESVFHVVDRLGNHHAITADSMNSDGESVVLWVGGCEVASFLGPLSAHRGASVAPAAEPLMAIGSTFLSSPERSPLVDAIESIARLTWEAPEGEDREFLRAHLVRLTGEQLHQLVPVPAASFAGHPGN